MKVTEDIKSPWLIHAKAACFLIVGVASAALLIYQVPTIQTIFLVAMTIWGFCRLYYYLFYVLERYLGREQRYAGLIDAIMYLFSANRRNDAPSANDHSDPRTEG